ncbi:phosphatidate cytidylyltransferase, partial [filamentous cyanobacterium CCP5]
MIFLNQTALWPLPHWLQIAVVLAWLGVVGGIAEGLRRWANADSEMTRKVVHIGAGHVIVLAWWLQTPPWMGIAAGMLFGAIALISYQLPVLPGINSVGRFSLGTFFYAVSIGVLTAIFWPPHLYAFAALGVLIMTWGDGLAAIVGQNLGRHGYKIGDIQKSWEGSLAMFFASVVVGWLVLGVSQGFSLLGLGQAVV